MALRRLDCHPIAMEDYVASDTRPLEKCLDDVRNCQIYLGIVARRYGYRPPDHDKSVTELEYEEALKAGLPCLIFLLADDAAWPSEWIDTGKDKASVEAFRRRLRRRHTTSYFSETPKLETLVTTAVALLQNTVRPPRIVIPPLLPYLSSLFHKYSDVYLSC